MAERASSSSVRLRVLRLLLALALAVSTLATLAVPPAVATGTTLTVEAAVDIDSSDNTCSLLEAFQVVDAALSEGSVTNDCYDGSPAFPITIELSSDTTYTLASNPNNNWATSNQDPFTAFPVLSGSDAQLTIEGNGATIERQGAYIFRFFFVQNGAQLTLRDLTLANGLGTDGGAIFASYAQLSIENSTLASNKAYLGGAIYVADATLTITGSTFSQNQTTFYDGGAILADGATLTITGSTFSQNEAAEDGGAIDAWDTTLTITGSTFSQNQAGAGGAIYVADATTLTITGSTFSQNQAGAGGAIDTAGAFIADPTTLTITGSTFSQNQADYYGGAIDAWDATLTITGSTFSQNWAEYGGAIFAGQTGSPTSTVVTNSTFSGNSTTDSDGGSAIYLAGTTASLAFVTLADHTGSPALAVGFAEQGTYRLKNVVLANPSVAECENDNNLTVRTAGAVLAQDNSCRSGVTVVPNLRSTLGDLADNGGPTQTHALLDTSPAIGAVPSGECTDWNDTPEPVTQDQRGQPRPNPADSSCDAGAYESDRAEPSGGIDLVVTSLRVREVGSRYCATVTVANQGTAAAPSTSLRLALSSTSSGGTPVATSSVPALGPGSTTTLTRCLSLPNDARRWLVATVDPANAVSETDESNNTRAVRFR